jgi:hypothetical protein
MTEYTPQPGYFDELFEAAGTPRAAARPTMT